MNEEERALVCRVAQVFKENRDVILDNWLNRVKKGIDIRDEAELEIFRNGFEGLLESFIIHLSNKDLDGYFLSNTASAREIAANDISYRKFILAFHMFEDSYSSILQKHFGGPDILKYINAIDHLHHRTIAIVSEEFFSIKDRTVDALVSLAELRDYTTGGHLERTREYLKVIAAGLGLDREFSEQLCKAGPLHDIGKVGIPDHILLKPGRLTGEEYEKMKKHTVIGAEAIEKALGGHKACRGYMKMARDIALYHHEKYDGSGYPEGLKGKAIPLPARIFALVDAYDAIVSRRPYKEPLSHEEALVRIKSDSGRHFDPDITAAFLEKQDKFKDINQSMAKACHPLNPTTMQG